MASLRRALAVLPLLFATLAAPRALAEDDSNRDAASATEAHALFSEGVALFRSGDYLRALAALQSSYEKKPSPNSLLMIARCLAKLGRSVEAAGAFSCAEQEARRLAREESRYLPTAKAAAEELAPLSAKLGRLRLKLTGAPAGTTVLVDDVEQPADGGGESFHEPGTLTVEVRAPGFQPLIRSVEVFEGERVVLAIEVSASAQRMTASHPLDGERPMDWKLPTAIAGGATGVVAMALAIGFGVSSRAIYADLEERCSPACGDGDRADAERGEAHATAANVLLAIGAAGLAAGGGLLTFHLLEERSDRRGDAATLHVSPGWIGVRARF